MIDDLTLSNEHAEAIVDQAIEFEVLSEDDKPSSKKDMQTQAHEVVGFAIDAWTNDGVNPENAKEDDDIDEDAAAQVAQIVALAGVEIDEDGDVTFGELPELEYEEGEEEEGDDDEEESEDEAPFDVNDIIEDYDDQKVADIIEAFKSGDLTADQIKAVQEYEEENGERAKILKFEPEEEAEEEEEESGDEEEEELDLDAMSRKELKAFIKEEELDIKVTQKKSDDDIRQEIAAAFEEDEEEAEEEPEEEEEEETEESEGEELSEPFEGYDGAKLGELKEAITEAAEEGDLSAEDVEGVIEYESANKNRKTFIKWLNALLEEGEEEEEEEPEGDEEAGEEVDAAVEHDDDREESKSRRKKKGKGKDLDLDDEEIVEMIPKGLARVFVQSQLDYATEEIEKKGLKVPSEYEGEVPELPDDISTVDHDDLSQLLLDFTAAHSTATWQASYYQIWSGTYEEIADYVTALAILDAEGSNREERQAEAATDERVVFFRAKYREAHNEFLRWRDLAKTYDKKGGAVSRVGGFVEGENAGSDRKATGKETAGKSKGAAKGAKSKGKNKVSLKRS